MARVFRKIMNYSHDLMETCWCFLVESLGLRGQQHDYADLSYLNDLVDMEGGTARGTLAGKEILIYAPEKTGTVSLFHSIGTYLKSTHSYCNYQEKLLHNHHNELLLQTVRSTSSGVRKHFLKDRMVIRDLVEYKNRHDEPLVIVSSYRDPLARAISLIFQRVENQVRDGLLAHPRNIDFADCQHRLMKFIERGMLPHPLEEIDPDFFSKETFSHSEKCLLVEKGRCKILVVCVEHSDKWADILATTLNYKNIVMKVRNQAAMKEIGPFYASFKEQLKLPHNIVFDLYFKGRQAKYVRWFYTQQEINDMYNKSLQLYCDP